VIAALFVEPRGVYDDGRKIVVERNVSQFVAEKLAGARRDSMKDSEVGDGWNYAAERNQMPSRSASCNRAGVEPRANEYA